MTNPPVVTCHVIHRQLQQPQHCPLSCRHKCHRSANDVIHARLTLANVVSHSFAGLCTSQGRVIVPTGTGTMYLVCTWYVHTGMLVHTVRYGSWRGGGAQVTCYPLNTTVDKAEMRDLRLRGF